jgi:hypothetical protein
MHLARRAINKEVPMQSVWLAAPISVLAVAAVQWWATRAWHRKSIAAMRARHASAQQTAAALLQQARQQAAMAQQELEAARQAAKRARPEPTRPAIKVSRERLNRMLDEAPLARAALPTHGFADTLPSHQFPPSTSFGLLQRSSVAA